jgi:CDP-paratose 2-epimerase
MRREFFGADGDTSWNLDALRRDCPGFRHLSIDIRDREAVDRLFAGQRVDLVIHCAAQPSHDLAARMPQVDFEVNAVGTLNLLEAVRRYAPEAIFIFLSTNKVYGDLPNRMPLAELPTRYDYAREEDFHGVDERMSIDQSTHSLFGVSKAAADLLVQEYGRYFGLKTGIFRGGCLTGSAHSGAELHGFLNYLVKCFVRGRPYTIYGYQGKQVRDNLHGADVVRAFEAFYEHPRPGEVYNIGGGRSNSVSILEAIDRLEQMTGKRLQRVYREEPRKGDHICYISDLRKLQAHYPGWSVTRDLEFILKEQIEAVSCPSS